MNIRSLAKNTAVAFMSQGTSMLISCITTLLVPKILGVEEFAYWQLFLFYSSYVGFFHFGLNDGVYLIHGGQTRDKIDKKLICSQFVVGTIIQIILAFIIILITLSFDFGQERNYVLTCTAYFLVVKNASSFLGFVFQLMNETKLFSFSVILERLFFFVPLIVLIVMRERQFEFYTLSYCFSVTAQLIFCLWHARDFIKAKVLPLSLSTKKTIKSIKVGIKLMLANIASMLILGIARFVIDIVWGIKTFGELSLSLSMVNFVLAFVSQASMVLFPALRQSSGEGLKKFFYTSKNTLSLILPLAYALYFPGVWILKMWLPQYANSFIFIAYLLPICVFDGKMNISCTTCLKVSRNESLLLKINVFITCLSATATIVGAYVLNSIWFIIGGIVFAIVIRSVISEALISKDLKLKPCKRLTISELLITVLFLYLAIFVETGSIGFFIYVAVYAGYLIVNAPQVIGVIQDFNGLFKKK